MPGGAAGAVTGTPVPSKAPGAAAALQLPPCSPFHEFFPVPLCPRDVSPRVRTGAVPKPPHRGWMGRKFHPGLAGEANPRGRAVVPRQGLQEPQNRGQEKPCGHQRDGQNNARFQPGWGRGAEQDPSERNWDRVPEKGLDRRMDKWDKWDKWDKLHPEEDVAPAWGTREPRALCSEWFPVQGGTEGLGRSSRCCWQGWDRAGLGCPSILQVLGTEPVPLGRAWLAPKHKGHPLQLQAGQ